MSPIPEAVVATLIEIGRQHESPDDALLPLLQRITPFAAVNRMSWNEWDPITQHLPAAELAVLFRGSVVTEKRLNWKGGSVAAGIWIHRELMRRDEVLARTVAAWALDFTGNPYIRRLASDATR